MNFQDVEDLSKLISDGYISVQKHPTAELYIYNYTHKCQFDKMWNKWTMMCRGLILDVNYDVVSRPFEKFFNVEELGDKVPKAPFKVYEKYDGSLGITYWLDDKPNIATRGSFTSEQALRATELLRPIYDTNRTWFNPAYTYLFEIIYPENRIVVDYGDAKKLVLLAIIETATGKEIDIHSVPPLFECAKPIAIEGFSALTELKDWNPDNKEGYVFYFPDTSFRCKVKHSEYMRLHKLITGVNERRIWEMLSTNGPDGLLVFLDRVPDEFYEWVRSISTKLLGDYVAMETKADQKLWYVEKLPTRKEQALWLSGEDPVIRSIVFAMLDDKDYKHIIWKHLKPKADKPFKLEV